MTKLLASLFGEEGSPYVFRKVTDAIGGMIRHVCSDIPPKT